MGYYQAGFKEIVGVDIVEQPRYPFKFVKFDALEYAKLHGHRFDVIHASPPCQAYSVTKYLPGKRNDHPDLIEETRELLLKIGLPFVIENVPGAPLKVSLTLCGTMFGLKVYRHRNFESNMHLVQPKHGKHRVRLKPKNCTGAGYYIKTVGSFTTVAGGLFSKAAGSHAMQIDWMIKRELAQAIPPAYTNYIGKQILKTI